MVCIQETKIEKVDQWVVRALWGSTNVGFSFRPSVGASGGGGNWCVCGDFNSIRDEEERKGRGSYVRQEDVNLFNSFIEHAELVDLPLCGRSFTWCRGDGVSMSRLDRFLLSEEWCQLWPNCLQIALARGLFDHCPIMLSINEENWGPKPFGMLKCWSEMPGYNAFVKEKWDSFSVYGWGGYVLKEKLKLMKQSLKEWHANHGRNIEGKLKNVKDKMLILDTKGEEGDLSEAEREELRSLSSQMFSLSKLHNSMQWQKSHLFWLKEGDANSNFFHCVMSNRRRGNVIHCIQHNGVQVDSVVGVRQAFFDHFKQHFRRVNVTRPGIENLHFKPISVEEAIELEKPFSEEEVKAAVWECDSFKSPGPDGVSFGFIKDFWEVLKGGFMRFLLEFYSHGKLVKGSNCTFIALVPKVFNPQRVAEFRPISLVESMYKVLAKILANRLKTVIGKVVSETQSAFVKGRQILDGILIVNEVVDDARKRKKEMFMFKVDFEKAYDSVDWSYLEEVMSKMGFQSKWRKWIMECISSVSASVLVNGSPTDEFQFGRGLRQWDPLSPFLFLMAAEELNVMLKAAVDGGLYKGYLMGDTLDQQVHISHLQFADDTLLVGEKSWANIRVLKAILILFELISGLKVNFHKSLLIGVNIIDTWLVDAAAAALDCKIGRVPFMYLALPIGGNPRQLEFWSPLLNRIRKKLLEE
ncbi:cysteine-rich receptor-like protein kinase [Trifolium medium]|uniref:Cysteine-rich receptor-like protein kinase n=1 Tax=Trifolium medium TaxID=97028 RepID=A0A392LZ96_9FABA|nr:cysteine-rich receptor-like protein kinase [Trifolium medium]